MIKNKNDQFSNGNKSVEAPLNVWQNQFPYGQTSSDTLVSDPK